MSRIQVSDEYYKGESYVDIPLAKGTYENCEFIDCSFANGDLSEIIFSRCTFDTCDMSMINLKETGLHNVEFSNCKLLGLHFEDCNQFMISVSFNVCIIEYCTFIDMKLDNTKVKECKLLECDFANTDLNNSIFSKTDLSRTKFTNCNLTDTDFSTAYNFSINPTENKMKGSLISQDGAQGLLDHFGIELC